MPDRICVLPECSALSRKSWFRGWCQPHYQRWRRHGDPRAGNGAPPGVILKDRLLAKIDRSGGPDACWPWLGTLSGPRMAEGNGYGEISVGGKRHKVTHLIYELYHGPLAEGLWVLHTCDNPPCVNHRHLFAGTQQDNMRDMTKKGRRPQGEGHWGARLTKESVGEIRERYARGGVVQHQLAEEYGVSQQSISDVVGRRYWKAEPVKA